MKDQETIVAEAMIPIMQIPSSVDQWMPPFLVHLDGINKGSEPQLKGYVGIANSAKSIIPKLAKIASDCATICEMTPKFVDKRVLERNTIIAKELKSLHAQYQKRKEMDGKK